MSMVSARRGRARFAVRLVQLIVGLIAYGASTALMVESHFGLSPWDVLHQGVAERVGVQIGWIVIAVGVLVLLMWIPLRQRPGIGTVANVIVIGLVANVVLAAIPPTSQIAPRAMFLVIGILMNGVATGMYIGAGLGPGPRDGLMTGLARRGHSIRVVRTLLEMGVLVTGFALGGSVGIGTVAYALSIGPLAHFFLPRFSWKAKPGDGSAEPASG